MLPTTPMDGDAKDLKTSIPPLEAPHAGVSFEARPFAMTPPEHLENLGLQETLKIACAGSHPVDVEAYGCWLGASVLPFAVAPTGDVYVLLGKEREDQTWKCGSNRWSDFGGRRSVESDLDCAETAGREFWEESCCVVSDVSKWFGAFVKESASSLSGPTRKAFASGGTLSTRPRPRGAEGFVSKRATPTNLPRDPRKELADLFRRGCYAYRLVRTGNVRPLPPAISLDEEGKPILDDSPSGAKTEDAVLLSSSGGDATVEESSKPAAIVGKSYVTFACRVPWDPAISEKFHVAVGWLGCLYDAVRLFHMTFYDLFSLPEEAKPVRKATSVGTNPALLGSSGEAPLPSRRASVVNFSSSGLTAAESLGSMTRITLGMILPYLVRSAALLSPNFEQLPFSFWAGFPKSATVSSVDWDVKRRVGRVSFLRPRSANSVGGFPAHRTAPPSSPWTLPAPSGASTPSLGGQIDFWIPGGSNSSDAAVDAILALQELVLRRERVKCLYRSVPAELVHHPSVSTETTPDGDLFSVVVKTEFLEKQAIQWWSLPRLTEMMANNGVYRAEQTRSSCNEMLSVVCQLLAQDFGQGRSAKRGPSKENFLARPVRYHESSSFSHG